MFDRKDIVNLKKDIEIVVNLLDNELTLHTRWGVFSPRSIDEGTLLLMKHIEVDVNDVCLDLGCGYGPIGLALAKHCTKGEVHMVDKDFVAVELANNNAKLNNLSNAKAYFSDAFLQIPNEVKFDQVISNLPAKVGREQLSIILYDALDALKPGGKITVVTINGLKDFIKNNFKSVFGNYKKLNDNQTPETRNLLGFDSRIGLVKGVDIGYMRTYQISSNADGSDDKIDTHWFDMKFQFLNKDNLLNTPTISLGWGYGDVINFSQGDSIFWVNSVYVSSGYETNQLRLFGNFKLEQWDWEIRWIPDWLIKENFADLLKVPSIGLEYKLTDNYFPVIEFGRYYTDDFQDGMNIISIGVNYYN